MAMVPNSSKINQSVSPLCSVCIANYNGEKFIEQCIESVLRQENFPGTVEIIVHDDASTDGSVSFIKDRYPQVHLLLSETNVGFCISNNKMVNVAQGKFILLLNNDAILHANALIALHDASVEHGEGIYGLPQYNAANGELIDIGSIFDPFLNPIPNKKESKSDIGMIIGACLWIPRYLWHALGGFPEWFDTLAEDMYICCLARLWGFPVKAISVSGFDHWVGKSIGGGKVLENKTLSTTFNRRFLSERNKTYVMVICYPRPIAWLLIPLHLLVFIIEGMSISLVKVDISIWCNIYWSALHEVWKNRKKILAIRTVIQRSKVIPFWEFFSPFTFIPHKIRMLLKHGLPQLIRK